MQRGLSPTSSTQSIQNLLAAESPGVVSELTDDDDYVMLDSDEEYDICEDVTDVEMREFEEKVEAAPPPKGAYRPSNLNRILLKKFKEKFSYQETWVNRDHHTLNYHILNDKDQKFILFGVVAEFKTLKDFELPTLEQAFILLKQREIYKPGDIILIPITEPFRGVEPRQGHFRLLAFANNSISYYDSKSYAYNRMVRFITPLRSAAELTLEEVAEQMTTAVGFLQKLKIMAQSAITLTSRYTSCLSYVEKMCKEYFPDMPFSENAMAQQAWHNHDQCGKNAMETGLTIASELSSEKINPRSITVGGP